MNPFAQIGRVDNNNMSFEQAFGTFVNKNSGQNPTALIRQELASGKTGADLQRAINNANRAMREFGNFITNMKGG